MAQQSASSASRVERERGGEERGFVQRYAETKPSVKTTELIVYVVASALILIAAYIADGYGASEAWRYFSYVTVGYLVSRGLAKAGSQQPKDDS